MSEAVAPRAAPGLVVLAVALTLATQTLASMAILGPAVLAPVAAAEFGVKPERIGLFVAVVYIVAMSMGLAGAASIARFGALRVCQICMATTAVGLGIGAAIGIVAGAWLALVAAVGIGVGYGLVNPATTHILARISPPSMLALILSTKQTGVPAGGMLAGLFVPTIALAFGWRTALATIAVFAVVVIALCEPARRRIDSDRIATASTAPRGWRAITAPLALVRARPVLFDLSLLSMAYSSAQTTVLTFMVAYANLELALPLVTAGLLYSVLTFAGIGSRIFWGAIADRMRQPRLLLVGLGIAHTILLVGLALLGPKLPLWGLLACGAALGMTALGWNGVHVAEMVRAAPPGQVGMAAGGSQVLTFFGALIGPAIGSIIVSVTGRYSDALLILGVLPLIFAVRLLRRSPTPST